MLESHHYLLGVELTPRKVESESQEDRSLSVITAKLIKSSARTGCDVGENALEVEVDEKHNNWFGWYGRKKIKIL